ncbi:MAG: hypothetical protein AAFP19_17205 [Bacteroidota bacterium]
MPTKGELINLKHLDFYSFFTKYSLMEEHGFTSGLIRRLFRKILPNVPDSHTIEYVLLNKKVAPAAVLAQLDVDTLSNGEISQQLDLSIKALCSKVTAFGLDHNIKAKFNFLELDAQPFENLFEKVDDLATCKKEGIADLITSLNAIELLIIKLRKNKNKIGTNYYLTLTTRRTLEYTHRIKELLNLKRNISSKEHWENLFADYLEYSKNKNSIRRYIRRRSDLVALEIVEHTSNKGEKYIAENRKEYWTFFYKSLLGGGIISVFAFLKIIISSYQLTPLGNAFFFSINYALCFILVKALGGIIATKQPAMTASTIAKNIDKQDELKIDSVKSIATLVGKVFRSQFISIIGNFLMALFLSCVIMYSLQLLDSKNLIKIVKPAYLIKNVVPSTKLLIYAAIAGFYLAMSGLISGYVDNKIVASKIAYRIRNNRFSWSGQGLAAFVEKKAGNLLGNICLGFLLGSTFLLSNILPFSVDIRHIAFSTANVGYAALNYDFNPKTILLALTGALLIGLINFIVSFAFTLYLALKSRGGDFGLIPKIVLSILKSLFR